MALFDSFATSGGIKPGGIIGSLTKGMGGGGILSTKILNTRISRINAAKTPQLKVQALVKTLGMRFKGGHSLIGGGTGSGTTTGTATTSSTTTDAGRIWSSYQAGPAVRGLNIDYGNPDVQWG